MLMDGALFCCSGLFVAFVAIGLGLIFSGASYFFQLRFLAKTEKSAFLSSLLIALLTMSCICSLGCFGVNWLLGQIYPTNPKSRPAEGDILGVWTLTSSSLQEMVREGGYEATNPTLIFKPDGTFEMTDMPDWWLDGFGRSTQTFYSGSGTWQIDGFFGRWEIQVYFVELTGYENGLVTSFLLDGAEPPYLIYTYLGDPDANRYMKFARQSKIE
jgi:hypothetical protein